MNETGTQMRRSISMPVKPLHLEPKTLKRSAEKETVYATDDSEAEDADANYLRQRSSPDMNSDNTTNGDNNIQADSGETTPLRGIPKHLRTVRESLANLVTPLFSFFRRPNDNELPKTMPQQRTNYSNPSQNFEQLYSLTPNVERELNEAHKGDQSNDHNEQTNGTERVTFSL